MPRLSCCTSGWASSPARAEAAPAPERTTGSAALNTLAQLFLAEFHCFRIQFVVKLPLTYTEFVTGSLRQPPRSPLATGSSESTTNADSTRPSHIMSPVDFEDRLTWTAQAAWPCVQLNGSSPPAESPVLSTSRFPSRGASACASQEQLVRQSCAKPTR